MLDSNVSISKETKPTEILDKIKNLGGNNLSDTLCRELWLSKIQPKTRILITPSLALPIAELAKQADTIWELQKATSPVSSVNAMVQQPVQSTSSSNFECALLAAMQEVTKELAALRAENNRNTRSRSRSPDGRRSRGNSRPRYRRNQTPGRKPPEMYDGECWYHYTFKNKSYKCREGCKHWDSEKYDEDNQGN